MEVQNLLHLKCNVLTIVAHFYCTFLDLYISKGNGGTAIDEKIVLKNCLMYSRRQCKVITICI